MSNDSCHLQLNDLPHLLLLIDLWQRGDLAGLVGSKHLAERTGGNVAGDAVDVDLLALMFLTGQWHWNFGYGPRTLVTEKQCGKNEIENKQKN